MKSQIGSETIRLLRDVIRESIRALPGKKFNIRDFESLAGPLDMIEYANERLEPLGEEGSSRKAFLLSSSDVLKISLNMKGVAQSRHEAETSEKLGSGGMITKVRRHDPRYRWIIAEIVRPVSSASEFEQASGMRWTDFQEGIRALGYPDRPPLNLKNKFLDRAIDLIERGSLHYGDLLSLDHWGITAEDRRIVLLDYGTSKQIWQDLYGKSSVRPDEPRTAPAKKKK